MAQRQQLTAMLEQLRREETDFLKLLYHTFVSSLAFQPCNITALIQLLAVWHSGSIVRCMNEVLYIEPG